MTGKRKAPSGSTTLPGQKVKGPRTDPGADGSSPEKRSFLHGSAFLIVCFACFLLGFRLSWEGKAAFLGAYHSRPESGKLVLRDTPVGWKDEAMQGGLDLRPGAWESGQGDKYGAGVADGEWERIEQRILASAGEVVNVTESARSTRFLPRVPPSPPEHPWVGRHNISIRPWPHPDAGETLLAHALIAAVQREQQNQFGVPLDCRKRVIVVTPTYGRAFQQVHLGHLTDTLRLAPEPLSWIVIEAGGPTDETQAILSKTGLADIHLLPVPGVIMPDVRAAERPIIENHLRDVALGYIQKTAMDGIVVFADDSATLRLALFQELQKVRWFAAFSVGMLVQGGGSEADLPVQGPVCGPGGEVRGWHAADHELLRLKKPAVGVKRALLGVAPKDSAGGEGAQRLFAAKEPGKGGTFETGGEMRGQGGEGSIGRQLQQLDQSEYWEPEPFIPQLEWVGFAFNARLLWSREERPAWLREWKPLAIPRRGDTLLEDDESDMDPTDLLARMVEDETQVETLGRCGKDVLAWWLRIEAADGGQYPAGWRLGEGLPVVAEPQEWSEEQWAEYEARLVEEKKKKKKKGKKKKKKKAPAATKAKEDAAARQAAEQAAADEARRVEEEKKRGLEQEAARQAEEERQSRLAAAEKIQSIDQLASVQETTAEVRTGPGNEGVLTEVLVDNIESVQKETLLGEGAKDVQSRSIEVAESNMAVKKVRTVKR